MMTIFGKEVLSLSLATLYEPLAFEVIAPAAKLSLEDRWVDLRAICLAKSATCAMSFEAAQESVSCV